MEPGPMYQRTRPQQPAYIFQILSTLMMREYLDEIEMRYK